MKGYPVFLIGLEGRRSIVVGGGPEARRKIDGLLENDAAITVIAQTVTEEIEALAAEGKLSWVRRGYRRGDLDGAFLVIAADQPAATNEQIWEESRAAGCLVNVMDDTEHCNFIAGSVVRRGALTVAISTNGCAPALAVRLRQRLERELGEEYGTFLELLSGLRGPMRRHHPDFDTRRELWYALVDSEILDDLRRGRHDRARRRAEQIVGGEPEKRRACY